MRLRVPSLALLSGLRIQCCHELWCRLQMQLRSGVAVAVVQGSSCSSNLTASLGTSIWRQCSPKKKKKKGVPVVAQWLTNPTRNHEVAGSVPALAQWVNDLALP